MSHPPTLFYEFNSITLLLLLQLQLILKSEVNRLLPLVERQLCIFIILFTTIKYCMVLVLIAGILATFNKVCTCRRIVENEKFSRRKNLRFTDQQV